jgi:hypothetical protein
MLKASPPQRRKSVANLLLVAPAFVVMGLLSVSVIWLIQQLQSTRCPSETFLNGAGQVATIVQAVPIFLGSIGLALLSVNWLVHLAPLKRSFDREARQHGEPGYERSQRSLAKFSFIVLAIMSPVIIAASFCQYCLTPGQILYQPWPWTGLRQYSWQDVHAVETVCTHGRRGGWNGSLAGLRCRRRIRHRHCGSDSPEPRRSRPNRCHKGDCVH